MARMVFGGPGDGQVCFCEIDGRVLGGMQFGDSCAGATVQSLPFRYLGSMLVYYFFSRLVGLVISFSFCFCPML